MDLVSGEPDPIERFKVIGLSDTDESTGSVILLQASNAAEKPRIIIIFFIGTYF